MASFTANDGKAKLGFLRPGDEPGIASSNADSFYEPGQKSQFVQGVFDRIASRYDFLNTLTSLGMHHRWRARTLSLGNLKTGNTALDIACGTGDFLPGLRSRVGNSGTVIGLDFSGNMLNIARARMAKQSIAATLVQGDAERLPFRSESMDTVTIGFALRNLADVEACFREMHRVLVPGGRLLALEISRPAWWPYRPLFLFYFERLLPRLAQIFGGEEQAYRWLPASLAAFYSRAGVTALMNRAGFQNTKIHDLAGGAVCIYMGEKP